MMQVAIRDLISMINRATLLSKLKIFIKKLIYRPSGVILGSNSFVSRPFYWLGGRYISIGKDTCIFPGSRIEAIDSWRGQSFRPVIEIGDGVYIGRSFFATSIRGISIGDLCVLSDHVYITDALHGAHPDKGPIMQQPLESKNPVRIGRSCFLGYRCAVMPGVILGEHCVVGVNSVVTRSFPAYSMIAGAPARLVKRFDLETREWVPAKE